MVQLRKTQEQDLDFVFELEHQPENSAFVSLWSKEQHAQALRDADVLHLIIETQQQQPVGYVILAGLNQSHQNLEFRRLVIGAKGQGFGKAALKSIKRLAFEELNAHRLWLDVKDFNTRAQRLYAAQGFVVEGVLRECLKVGDQFESLVLMSMLQQEYGQQIAESNNV